MPRSISPASLAAIGTQFGIEPVSIVAVQWVKDGQLHYYSDRRIDGQVEGRLLELSDIEAVLDIQRSGSSTSIHVKLDDVDGVLKSTFNVNDIHSRPVTVYQWFANLPLSEKFIVFEGVIASQIEWDEGARTLAFEVLTKLEDREVGFSVEDGDFTNVPEEVIGKSWPLIFGTVENVRTLKMDTLPVGTLRTSIGIPDPTLAMQIGYVNIKRFQMQLKANCLVDRGTLVEDEGRRTNDKSLFEQGQGYIRQANDLYRQLQWEGVDEILRLQAILAHQLTFDLKSFSVINGNKFPQNSEVQLNINSAHYYGSFSGETFHVRSRRGPDEPAHRAPPGGSRTNERVDVVIRDYQEVVDRAEADRIFGSGGTSSSSSNTPVQTTLTQGSSGPVGSETSKQGGPKEHQTEVCVEGKDYYIIRNGINDNFNKQREGKFFYANAGSQVKIGGGYPIRYIISIIPGTTVLNLSARHTNRTDDLKELSPIPPQYYTITNEVFGGLTAVIATFDQPLSGIVGEDWEDEVFATVTSPIGPNVVIILEWLINNYTEFTFDPVSFGYVYTKVADYPANFALLERKNVVELLKDIAWQARCAIWLVNGIFYLKFLPEDQGPIETITADDIVRQTMVITTTPTEDLCTKMIGEWRRDYSQDKYNTVIMRFNINKYGTHEQRFAFYIYNNVDLVVRAMTFWLIRLSNVWKVMNCKTFISKLKLETQDTAAINVGNGFIANSSVNGIVQKATFNSDDLSIDLSVWLPVRLGEMEPYQFAYPAGLDVTVLWPTVEEIAGGFAGDGVQASGDFGAKVNLIVNKIPGRSGGGTASNTVTTPVITTVAGGYGTGQGSQTSPTYDYRYNSHTVPPATGQNPPPSKSMPGQIVSGSAKTYVVDIYPFGIDEDPVRVSSVKQLEISDDEAIPVGTWVIVSRLSFFADDDNTRITTLYYIQAPVWMEPESLEE